MSRTYSAEGIVLKRSNIGEADRLVTFLLRYRGKLTAIAKGVRKISSRKAPNLELLNHVKLHLAKGKTFDIVTEAESIEAFKNLKSDLARVSFGFYLAEITNEFLAEGQGGRDGFELFGKVLGLIDQENNLEKIKLFIRAFEVKFLESLGFKPELDKCVRCGRILGPSANFLSPEVGGVVEKSCRGSTLFAQPISRNTLVALRFLQREDWNTIQRLAVSANLNKEIEGVLRFYLEHLLEKEIKSARFVNKVVGRQLKS
ncbi:MAG: DNA repair protein RecO [Candidatus Woykebacteria bacterium GWB1_45_5]|uniref:DNA repair protein RecO n=2 Tax=Candidatus Woykeibacteriota TaxID=1817899 RepID=A0A1G1W2Q2_9BACT|nr:MAG: DNA repair protein RecO [Candidatus Woykebacteria bacterium GWA1_44_8]OGY23044.1 MAG: DNA repair protein RecO [Candidatus Woykebacteria bacterium GWB1_45_5]